MSRSREIQNWIADLVIDACAELGECPVWHSARKELLFVDITGRKLYAYDPLRTDSVRALPTPEFIGCIAPARSICLIAALASGVALIGDEGEIGAVTIPQEHDASRCRFNDGKCDPQGRFWAGTMSLSGEAGAGSLYCFTPGCLPRLAVPNVTTSNGLAWSRDGGTLFYIDSRTRRVDSFTFEPESGSLSDRRPRFDLSATGHIPDGCTLDAEGMLWVAHWGGGCVTRWDPASGRQLARVDVPAPQVTSCTFGGTRFDTLYITTARRGLSQEQLQRFPESGGVFACTPTTHGLEAHVYSG